MDIKKDGPLHFLRTIFQFTCQGESDKSSKLLLREVQVNRPVTEVCRDSVVRMAFNQNKGVFEIDVENNNTMVSYPVVDTLKNGAYANDILSSFFTSHHLTPTWQDANGTFGWFDEETGLWTGAVGLVSRICVGG